MVSKSFKGYRTVPVQDGTSRVRLERIPHFGHDTSKKIRTNKSKRVKVMPQGFAALLTPVKGGK